MKQFRSKNKQGFTLIELLVVIAIIGILSTLLFPAIQGALAKTKATAVGTKLGSRGLTGILYDISLDNNIANLPEEFPRVGQYGNSTEFFEYIFSLNAVTGSMTIANLSIPGQANPPLSLDNFDASQNMWNVVEGITTSSDPGIPFMFTKNISWTSLDVEPSIETDADNGQPILGDELAIIVYAQGAVKIVKLTPTLITKEVLAGGGNYENVVLAP